MGVSGICRHHVVLRVSSASMDTAAVIFITLGVMIVGFGLLSLANILNMSFTEHQREHADITDPGFRRLMAKFMIMGFVIIAIGVVFALLA